MRSLVKPIKDRQSPLFGVSSKSNIFGSQEYVGSSPVTDNRIAISGKTIDGYIEGANVFFDVNFNQRLDAGEYSATTNENGFFEIRVNAEDESCVKARPIIADVPVGANDSSLGEVTKAYQMVLPSVNDAGSNQIVISPFTSLMICCNSVNVVGMGFALAIAISYFS